MAIVKTWLYYRSGESLGILGVEACTESGNFRIDHKASDPDLRDLEIAEAVEVIDSLEEYRQGIFVQPSLAIVAEWVERSIERFESNALDILRLLVGDAIEEFERERN